MKNWPLWMFVIAVVVVVLFALNYEGTQDGLSLNDLFPEEQIEQLPDIEYEFVGDTQVQPREESDIFASAKTVTQSPAIAEQERLQVNVASNPVQETVPSPQIAAVQKPNFSKVPFTIQVASFRDLRQAELALKGMKAAGYPAYIATRDLGAKGTWHRIYVGEFDTQTAANDYLSQVKPKYKDSFVIAPKSKAQ